MSLLSLLCLTSACTMQEQMVGYDDTYYDNNELANVQQQEEKNYERASAWANQKAYQDPAYSNEAKTYSQRVQGSSDAQNNEQVVDVADSNYSSQYSDYNQDNYYDYAYSARINRFHRPYYWLNYYDDYYTDLYWYTFDPLSWGVSIYLGYSWWYPSYYYRPYYWDWNYSYGGICYFNYRDGNSFFDRSRGRNSFDPNRGRGLASGGLGSTATGFPTSNRRINNGAKGSFADLYNAQTRTNVTPVHSANTNNRLLAPQENLTSAQNQRRRIVTTTQTNGNRERFSRPQNLNNNNNNIHTRGGNAAVRTMNTKRSSAQTYTPPMSSQPRSNNEFRSGVRSLSRSIFSNQNNNSNNNSFNRNNNSYRQTNNNSSSHSSSIRSGSSSSRSSGGGFSGGSSRSCGGRSR